MGVIYPLLVGNASAIVRAVGDSLRGPTTMSNASTAPIFGETQSAGQYEFSETENKVFRALATEMHAVGTAYMGLGVGLIVASAVVLWAYVASLPIALVMACIAALGILGGHWLRVSSVPLARIADTSGSDISHLMRAMGALERLFNIQRKLLAFAAVMGVVGVVGGVLFVLFAPAIGR